MAHKKNGWFGESLRHSLASHGVRTRRLKKGENAIDIIAHPFPKKTPRHATGYDTETLRHIVDSHPFLEDARYFDMTQDGEIWYVWYGDKGIVAYLDSGEQVDFVGMNRATLDEAKKTIRRMSEEDILPGR